jgi:hypothetical protein
MPLPDNPPSKYQGIVNEESWSILKERLRKWLDRDLHRRLVNPRHPRIVSDGGKPV